MKRLWFWLLYRLGIRKPPPLTDLVLATLRAHPEMIANNVIPNNALLRHLKRRTDLTS